ncbi:MAG: Metallothiol transferase FosB [Candidatus Heimdallarchaeota archaeon LC_3]|nr:MAG: Metallothiol transferase FosB [Candidatus Heimdallarchaeota archaeon LC_3]
MTNGNDFPTEDMEMTSIVVVENLEKSKHFYLNILGATLFREYGGSSCVLKFQGVWLLLVTGGEPTPDKPGIIFTSARNETNINHSFTIRVKNCQKSYEVLKSRGAQFLTPPYDWEYEVRAFFRDPDGNLFEISENKGE